MIINDHDIDYSTASGNGHHGNCKYCRKALITDLGYCSWDYVKCIDREIDCISDLPDYMKSYINFRGFRYNQSIKKLIKAYSNESYSFDELELYLQNIKI